MPKSTSRPRPQTLPYKAPATDSAKPSTALPPLKPRPKLLILMSVLLAIWVGALLTLYFAMVRPYRHWHDKAPIPATAPATQFIRGVA